MMHTPVDAAYNVSPELSIILENRLNNPDIDQPVTLGDVRDHLQSIIPDNVIESENLHPQFDANDAPLEELDALIEEYGEEAPAMEFTRTYASEPLTRIIETAINDNNREAPPTLEDIRMLLASGGSSRLVGDGVLEEDEDDPLLEEVDFLIGRHGSDMLAEDLMRYE
jgi:hypothetical protein